MPSRRWLCLPICREVADGWRRKPGRAPWCAAP